MKMNKIPAWKLLAATAAAGLVFGAGVLFGALNKPKSVIHVVTVKWKDGTPQEKIDAALKGVETLAQEFDGITRVWTRSIKVQGYESGVTHAFVMEFKDEQALEDYAGSPAQKKWYEVYIPIRDRSRTFDITN